MFLSVHDDDWERRCPIRDGVTAAAAADNMAREIESLIWNWFIGARQGGQTERQTDRPSAI